METKIREETSSDPEYAGGELDSKESQAFASKRNEGANALDSTTQAITTSNLTTDGDNTNEEVQPSNGKKPKKAEDASKLKTEDTHELGTSDSENHQRSSGVGDVDGNADFSFAAVASALEELTLSDSEDITLFDRNSVLGYHGDVDQMSLPKKTASKLEQQGKNTRISAADPWPPWPPCPC